MLVLNVTDYMLTTASLTPARRCVRVVLTCGVLADPTLARPRSESPSSATNRFFRLILSKMRTAPKDTSAR